MKAIIGSFILGALFMFLVMGAPNVVYLWKSISDREILSQTADIWWAEGYRTGFREASWGRSYEVLPFGYEENMKWLEFDKAIGNKTPCSPNPE